jgi:hypothetical protein
MRPHRPRHTPRVEAASRCLVALAFAGALIGLGVGAALTASRTAALAMLEVCGVVFPLACVTCLELGPALSELWTITAEARRVTKRFCGQLDALPETTHPLRAYE